MREFPAGEGFECFVEDFGQTFGAHKRCPLHIRPVEHGNFLHSGDRVAAELGTREVAQGEYRLGRLRSDDALRLSCDLHYLFCATVGQIDEENLPASVGYKTNAIHTGSSRRLRSTSPRGESP